MTPALMVWGASDAVAGGPTSVLVTSPERGQARGLYHSDEPYGKLQQLLVTADGTPRVRTDPAPEVADDDIRWHRAPRAVFAQLERAGVLGETDGAGRAVEGGSGSAELAGHAWWAAAGVAVGVGGTLLIRRAAARGEAGPPREEPRQELIDL